jgi:hypothetical protein
MPVGVYERTEWHRRICATKTRGQRSTRMLLNILLDALWWPLKKSERSLFHRSDLIELGAQLQ